MFLFGILLAGQVLCWFEEYSSVSLNLFFFFDISHSIASCQESMNHCAECIEFSSGSSKQINSLPAQLKAPIPCTAQET